MQNNLSIGVGTGSPRPYASLLPEYFVLCIIASALPKRLDAQQARGRDQSVPTPSQVVA